MNASTMHQSFKAYSRANHTVPKTRQIVMLYDGVIRNLQQACEAMKQNKIEERFNKLVRASEIVIGLQSCLDFDSGRDAAQILYDFYSSVDSRIFALHRNNDIIACEKLITEVKSMRTMWYQIDQGEAEDNQAAAPQSSQDGPLINVESFPTENSMQMPAGNGFIVSA